MLGTTPVTREITKLIATGTTEQAILSAVAYLLPAISRQSCRRCSRRRGCS